MKNIFKISVLVISVCLVPLSCTPEEQRLDSGPESNSFVRITHTSDTYTVPAISGSGFSAGSVQWGDGRSDKYSSGLTHIYSGSGEYTVVIGTCNPEKIRFNGIGGIADIDLSSF